MVLKDRKAKRGHSRRLLRLGTIRLGRRVEGTTADGRKFERPEQTPFFVIKDAPEIAGVYGAEPREIDVLFPFSDVERNFDAFYMVWAGGVPVCKGDGETILSLWPHKIEKKKNGSIGVYNSPGEPMVDNGVALRDFEIGEYHFSAGEIVACPGENANMYPHCAACKRNAVLKLMIAHPDIFRFGYYQISTGGGRNYDHITDTLEEVHEIVGQVSAIPFKLRIIQDSTVYMDKGQRRSTQKYFLQLEPPAEIMMRVIEKQREQMLSALPMSNHAIAAIAADDDYEDDYEYVQAEAAPPYALVEDDAEQEGPGKLSELEIAKAFTFKTKAGNKPLCELEDKNLEWIINNVSGDACSYARLVLAGREQQEPVVYEAEVVDFGAEPQADDIQY